MAMLGGTKFLQTRRQYVAHRRIAVCKQNSERLQQYTGVAAIKVMQTRRLDAAVLEADLPSMSGFELADLQPKYPRPLPHSRPSRCCVDVQALWSSASAETRFLRRAAKRKTHYVIMPKICEKGDNMLLRRIRRRIRI